MATEHTRQSIDTDLLDFDVENPRLVGEGITVSSSDQLIIGVLSKEADIAELVISILQNGFVDFEPIVVLSEGGRFRVLEGNRRLAAIKLLKDQVLAGQLEQTIKYHIDFPVAERVLETIQTIPAIIVNEVEEAHAYIGFKHINGPHKWSSYAKAKFVTQWHKLGASIDEIARRVGDKNQTVKNLIGGMLILEQAEEEELFEVKDRTKRGPFGFSHLYTALNRKPFRDYVGLDKDWQEDLDENPIEEERHKQLKTVLNYIYGSKSEGIESVIKSQNPHLKQLGEVLSKPVAAQVLFETNNLERALEETEEKSALFEKYLVNTHTNLQRAFSNVSSYNGNEGHLDLAREMKKNIKLMVNNMESMV